MPRPLVRKVKGTIVVAHDDHTVVMLVSELLRKHGFRAVSAFDATQVMLMVRQFNPQAVILDHGIPGGTGMDVLKRLRALYEALLRALGLPPEPAESVAPAS